MAVDYYTYTAEDAIGTEERQLYELIMDYRASLGLPAIPLSPSLSTVAARHAVDTVENVGAYAGHAWSDAPYDSSDPDTYPNMWEAPQRLGTPYQGNGYEITTGYTEVDRFTMTAEEALANWQSSPPHDAVITNSGPWDQPWQAIGIGMVEGIAHVWFGHETDPALSQAEPKPSPSPINALSDDDARLVAYLYEAALDRDGNIDLPGLNFWIDQREAGMSEDALAFQFLDSPEFRQQIGNIEEMSDQDLVRALYRNVLDREGEQEGIDFWVDVMDNGFAEQSLVLAFANSPENRSASPEIETLYDSGNGEWAFA
ncbi:MAG: DUF4214 domain-containing protein [Pseudomonadota bacterium]